MFNTTRQAIAARLTATVDALDSGAKPNRLDAHKNLIQSQLESLLDTQSPSSISRFSGLQFVSIRTAAGNMST